MDQKELRYFKRTLEHIHRVHNCMGIIVTMFRKELQLTKEDCRILMYSVLQHDLSKFSIEQFEPYIELTEFYFQRKTLGNLEYQYPPGMGEKVSAAVEHHYNNENHHPERNANGIGKWDKYQAIETVCDLQAMAIEFNEGTCRKYFETVWKPKQMKFFYDDYNWIEVVKIMDRAIQCFENYDRAMKSTWNLRARQNTGMA